MNRSDPACNDACPRYSRTETRPCPSKTALGTGSISVFRKLRELAYSSSYSHRGKYYTLDEIARFDAMGLWSFRSVWFSRHGTLL